MYVWKRRVLAEHLTVTKVVGRIPLLVIGGVAAAVVVWLIGGASSLNRGFQSLTGTQPVANQEIPTLTLCQLLASPEKYDLKVIRIRSTLLVNDGDRSLYDQSCVTMEPMVGVLSDPSLHYNASEGIQEEFYDLLDPTNEIKQAGARVTMVGRFEGPNFPKDGRQSRFQHQFIVMRIEKAESEKPGLNSISQAR
jgi:hypothetical protein